MIVKDINNFYKLLDIKPMYEINEKTFAKDVINLISEVYPIDESTKMYNKVFDSIRAQINIYNKLTNYSTIDVTDENREEIDKSIRATEEIIHENYQLSTVFGCSLEYPRYVGIANFFDDKKEYLGSTVADLGCGNGFLTCYIALQNPNIKIVGYDISCNAIKIANKLKNKLNLTNVEFVNDDMFNIKEKFDTVINICAFEGNRGEYQNLLHKILKDNGTSIYFDLDIQMPEEICSYLAPDDEIKEHAVVIINNQNYQGYNGGITYGTVCKVGKLKRNLYH